MSHQAIAAKLTALGTTLSPYPASFDNNPVRYALALTSLMSISMFGAVVLCWMGRDIWLDRHLRLPTKGVLLFRTMMATCGLAAFMRCLPEVVYMSAYGEVTGSVMATILAAKRTADIVAFPIVVQWMMILVWIYPSIVLGMTSHASVATVPTAAPSKPLSRWHRLGKPAVIFATIVLIASLMAYAKWTLAHHG